MDAFRSKSPRTPPVGAVLKEWRSARRLSQLALALEAGVSARHLSFVETGKAQPSREMVARLAETLAIPLRERNALLVAAGFAPEHPETALDAPSLARVRRAIDLILAHQEPYPAFMFDQRWEILQVNQAAMRVGGFLMAQPKHTNMILQHVDPEDIRSVLENWEEVAGDLLRHLHDVIAANPTDTKARALFDQAMTYPGVAELWRAREEAALPTPLLTARFRKGEVRLSFFSTVTAFITPRDVTLEGLRVECVFPADEATADFCRSLAG